MYLFLRLILLGLSALLFVKFNSNVLLFLSIILYSPSSIFSTKISLFSIFLNKYSLLYGTNSDIFLIILGNISSISSGTISIESLLSLLTDFILILLIN